jgi:hypothetical protein
MTRFFKIIYLLLFISLISCNSDKKGANHVRRQVRKDAFKETTIVDCHYTLEQAIEGSNAPKRILNQLQLIDVRYYSTDGKIHQGQILTNKKMVPKIEMLFQFILKVKFPVAHAIPIVKYNWNDDASMQANNTYSFCYRDISYSKHARGMAIDINPFYNPVRWKKGYEYRQNKPIGAHYNPDIPGTFYSSNPVVLESRKFGLRWGHSFTRNYDDHHFEI